MRRETARDRLAEAKGSRMFRFNMGSFAAIAAWAMLLAWRAEKIAPAARVYPLILIALVLVCGAVVAVQEIHNRAATEPLDPKIATILASPASVRFRLLGFLALWLAYCWALTPFGFVVSTTVAIATSMWLLGTRRTGLNIAAAVVFSCVLLILFQTILYIPVPSGVIDLWLIKAIYALHH